jgi:hypothetical protein
VYDDELVEGESPGEVIIGGSVENTEPELQPSEDEREREPPEPEREFPGLWIRLFDEDGNLLSQSPADVETLERGETKRFEVSISEDPDDIEEYRILISNAPPL